MGSLKKNEILRYRLRFNQLCQKIICRISSDGSAGGFRVTKGLVPEGFSSFGGKKISKQIPYVILLKNH